MPSVRSLALLLPLFLLGCATSPSFVDPQELDSEGDSLSDGQKVLFERANTDFKRASSDNEPKYAILKWALRDGGTEIYEGDGYSLTSHNGAFAKQGDVNGRLAGATMTLHRKITGSSDKTVSTKRFVPTANNNRQNKRMESNG